MQLGNLLINLQKVLQKDKELKENSWSKNEDIKNEFIKS